MAGERYSEPTLKPKIASERADLQAYLDRSLDERNTVEADFAKNVANLEARLFAAQEVINDKFGVKLSELDEKHSKNLAPILALEDKLREELEVFEREVAFGKYDGVKAADGELTFDQYLRKRPKYDNQFQQNKFDAIALKHSTENIDASQGLEDDDDGLLEYETTGDVPAATLDGELDESDAESLDDASDELEADELEDIEPDNVAAKRAKLQARLNKVVSNKESIESRYELKKESLLQKQTEANLSLAHEIAASKRRLDTALAREQARFEILEKNLYEKIDRLDTEIAFGLHDEWDKNQKRPDGELTFKEYIEERPTDERPKFMKKLGSFLFGRHSKTETVNADMGSQERQTSPYESMTLVQILKELATAHVQGYYDMLVEEGALDAARSLIEKANKDATEEQIDSEMNKFIDRVETYALRTMLGPQESVAKPSGEEVSSSESSDDIKPDGPSDAVADSGVGDSSDTEDSADAADSNEVTTTSDVVDFDEITETSEATDAPEAEENTDTIESTDDDPSDPEGDVDETEEPSGLSALDSMLEGSQQAREAQSVEASTEAKGAWGKFKEGLKSLRTYGASSYWGYKWDEARRGVGKALNNVLNIGVNGEMSFEEAEKVRKRNRHVMVAGAAVVVGVGMVMRLQAGGSIASASPGESLDQILPLGPDSPMDTNMQDMLPYQDGIGDSGASGINGPEGLPAEADIDIVDKDKILWNESSSGESLDVDPAEAQAEEVPAPNNETTWNESTNENSTSDNTSADNDTLWPEQLPTDLPDVKEGEGGISYFERNGLTEQAWYDHEQELLEKFGGDGGDFYQMGDGHVGLSRAGQLSLEAQTYINGLK